MHDTDLLAIFHRRLRTERKARGQTQAQLAERAGLSKEFIGRLERGITAPSVKTLAKLAAALEVEAGELLCEAGLPTECVRAPGRGDNGGCRILREAFHRQKNNLNLLYGYLRLTSQRTRLVPVDDILPRIRALAHLDEFMYTGGDTKSARLDTYLHSLLASLERTGLYPFHCRLRCDPVPEELDYHRLCHVGTFVTEALLNAAKHAFTDDRDHPCRVELACCLDEDGYRLAVRDNGIGIDGPPDTASSLGLELMREAAKSLDGSFGIFAARGGGTVVEMVFPPAEETRGGIRG